MKIYNILLAGALTICTRATSPDDPPIADFSSYGLPGCHEHTQQNYTLVQTQDSLCFLFTPPFPTNIQSAFTTNIISGCVGEFSTATAPTPLIVSSVAVLTTLEKVYVYTDANCRANETTLGEGVENCYDEPAGLGSYMVVCGHRYPTPFSSTASPSASACHG